MHGHSIHASFYFIREPNILRQYGRIFGSLLGNAFNVIADAAACIRLVCIP